MYLAGATRSFAADQPDRALEREPLLREETTKLIDHSGWIACSRVNDLIWLAGAVWYVDWNLQTKQNHAKPTTREQEEFRIVIVEQPAFTQSHALSCRPRSRPKSQGKTAFRFSGPLGRKGFGIGFLSLARSSPIGATYRTGMNNIQFGIQIQLARRLVLVFGVQKSDIRPQHRELSPCPFCRQTIRYWEIQIAPSH